MSAITVEGDLVHYEKLGRGRPVILLHGWIGSWRYWIPTMQQLQLKFSVYAIDLFGFGDSSKSAPKYTLDKQVELLNVFFAQMGIPKAAFVAHGLGVLVACEFARRNPDKTARMLLVSAPLFDPGGLAERNAPGHLRPLTPLPLTSNVAAPAVPAAATPDAPVTTPLTQNPAPQSADLTILSKSAPAPSHSAPTIISGGTIDRATLARVASDLKLDLSTPTVPAPIAAETPASAPDVPSPSAAASASASAAAPSIPAAAPSSAPKPGGHNPLQERLNSDLDSLLGKCFKRSETAYDKLKLDIARTDTAALRTSAASFDSLEMLDKLHMLDMPLVFVHGKEDPIIEHPSENVWNYLATTKPEDKLLPIPMQGVRHFPMLENDRFTQLVTDFLEKPDISSIEVQERWRRRAR
ncbi:MAG: alpha/beta hydrolase [Anaerolineae bacterium]